jgi:hypothetical protein
MGSLFTSKADGKEEAATIEELGSKRIVASIPYLKRWAANIFYLSDHHVIRGFSLLESTKGDPMFSFRLNLGSSCRSWRGYQLLVIIKKLIALMFECRRIVMTVKRKIKITESVAFLMEPVLKLFDNTVIRRLYEQMRRKLQRRVLPYLVTQYLL